MIKTRELTEEEKVDLSTSALSGMLVGKRIIYAEIKGIEDKDDTPFLCLKFEDGTKIIIEAQYGGYTGHSEDEYRRQIEVFTAEVQP